MYRLVAAVLKGPFLSQVDICHEKVGVPDNYVVRWLASQKFRQILCNKLSSSLFNNHHHHHHHHHHWVILLLVEHRASVKSFQALRSLAVPLTSFHNLLCFLFHPLLSLATFSSAYLFFYTAEDSNLMRFSLLPLLLYAMCVQSNSIFFFLSKFLLASVW
jgi:hypothetical protein